MKGKIDNEGHLYIERGRRLTEQGCPYSSGEAFCGDWCPLFGEPNVVEFPENETMTCLQTCRNPLYFDEFTDERENQDG